MFVTTDQWVSCIIFSDMTNENLTPMAFQFNATSQEIRSFLIEQEPWFVAKDLCDVLGIQNARLAITTLDEDEKLTYKIHTSGQRRKSWLVSESGLYALVMRSSKPEARMFRKWVTKEVLPTIRKKGYYSMPYAPSTFTDLRTTPLVKKEFNGFMVRTLLYKDQTWVSMADLHCAIGCQTSVTQTAKKLNAKDQLASKFWVFGATHPAWFTNALGFQLVVGSSRVYSHQVEQLKLEL